MPDPVTGVIAGSSIIGGVSSSRAASRSARAAEQASEASIAEQRRQFDLVREDTAPIRSLGNSAVDRINRLYGYAPTGSAGVGESAPMTFEEWSRANQSQIPSSGGGIYGNAFRMVDTNARNAQYQQYLEGQGSAGQPSAGNAQTGPDMSAFFESPDYQFNLSETMRGVDRAASAGGRYDSGAVRRETSRYASGLASREYASFYDRLAQQAGLGTTGIGASASAGANAASNIGNAYMNAGNARGSAYASGAAGVNNAIQGGLQNWAVQNYLGRDSAVGAGTMANNYRGQIYGGYA